MQDLSDAESESEDHLTDEDPQQDVEKNAKSDEDNNSDAVKDLSTEELQKAEDEEEAVIGKKRKALSKLYDPSKHRKKKVRMYYNRGSEGFNVILR